jgi:signal transduction histidine kinase
LGEHDKCARTSSDVYRLPNTMRHVRNLRLYAARTEQRRGPRRASGRDDGVTLLPRPSRASATADETTSAPTLGLRRHWSFRAHVVALVLASVLPLAGLAIYSMMQLSEGERIAGRAEIISTAHAVSSIIDQRLDGNLKTMRALAKRFPGLSGDLGDFYRDCAAFAAESDGAILLADTTGRQIFNSKRSLGTSLPRVFGTPEFWEVVANAEPRIGNAFISPVDGTASFAILVPVIKDDHAVAVLGITFPTRALSDLLAAQRLPADWTLAAVDRTGTIFARHNGTDRMIGMKAGPEVMAMPSEQDEALFQLRNREGVPNYMGVARSALSGWRVVVGIPAAVIEAPLHRSLQNFVVLGGGVLLLAIGMAALIGGRLAANMKTLARAARSLARHETLPFVASTVGEIDSVADALSDAALDLARSEKELRAVEERLRRSERHLLSAQRVAAIGSFEVAFKTNRIDVSDETYRILGLDPKVGSLTPALIESVVLPEDLEIFRKSFADAAAGKRGTLPEYRIRRPDGVRTLHREVDHVLDADGNKVGYIGVIKDVTDLREAERQRDEFQNQLLHAQKLEALGTLAGGIAHDLNNTLVPVLGLAKLTLKRLPDGSREHANVLTMLHAGERARDLVRQILAFSRKEGPSRKAFEIVLVARDALLIARASIPSTIRIVEAIEQAPPVLGDAGQLHQVIINLVVNAAHAIGDAMGTITVALAPVDARLPNASSPPVPAIHLSVGDTGRGIDAETLPRIFEPFFTTKPVGEGTGLGLSLVHGIVVQHGGRIAVESRVGQGTRFDIFLPALMHQVIPLVSAKA